MAFFLVVHVVALVLTAIWPLEHAWALHFVVAPHALVLTAIGPVVNTYGKMQCLQVKSLHA